MHVNYTACINQMVGLIDVGWMAWGPATDGKPPTHAWVESE